MGGYSHQSLLLPVAIILSLVVLLLVGGGAVLRRSGKLRETSETSQRPGDSHPDAAMLGYEPQDVSARSAAYVLATIATVAGVAILVLFGLIGMFTREDHAAQPQLTPQQQARIVPPGPQLQADPYADLQHLRQAQLAAISGYGWTGPDHRRARIPIDRAMALTIGRSLNPAP